MQARTILSIFLIFIFFKSFSQQITGQELLSKAITFHDPNGSWSSLKATFEITMNTPDGKKRASAIEIDLPSEYFQVRSVKEGITLTQTLEKGECKLLFNGSSTFSKEDAKKHQLNCERATMYKNYYTYLYGLPMKLKDPGTIIDAKTQRKTFKGKEYLVLRVTYEKEVGDDIWYFYFDPKTYAMEVYQFFHDESKNDGEYILLTDLEEIVGMKLPKNRAWYYNKDDKYLGTDKLKSAELLEN